MTRVLVVGPPRSGTTWIAQALGRCTDTRYVHEPDGTSEVFALRAKRGRPVHLALDPHDVARDYERLWAGAFAGGHRSRSARARLTKRLFDQASLRDRTTARTGERVTPALRLAVALAQPLGAAPSQHVVVKSVHACLAAEWIATRFAPRVVVVERHGLNVLASWKQLGHGARPDSLAHLAEFAARAWGIALPVDDVPRMAQRAMSYAVLTGALHDARTRHPDWLAVRHEELLSDPLTGLGALAATLGLEFSTAAAAYVEASNQPGERYVTRRVTSELVDKWQRTLTDDEVRDAIGALGAFPPGLGFDDAIRDGTAWLARPTG
ncbi:MAG TPA: sulfotransferase [Acidimicrobiia bacterium]|nr:sulfotransferase [Acidimicrobiia bacterium]